MIGKVLRGTNARRLLYYLYCLGKANEHTDPHLVAGFSDPAELEPEQRPGGSRDFRRLAGLLAQPMAALAGPGYAKPVWHCAVRAAPGDRLLSDAEWAQVAEGVMDRTGLAAAGDDLGVRWVAVRHGADHVHIVATLARQDGTRPRIWNDFYRVREACLDAEARFGLAGTAAADRTAARRPSRAEAEQASRRGWDEPPRDRLRREVCTAAAAARSESEFFARLAEAGVSIRRRYSTTEPGQVTGYAVGLLEHTTGDGGVVWYGGGKLAADLTLPRLRRRWPGPSAESGAFPGSGLPAAAARAVLRAMVTDAARQAGDEDGFFTRLAEAGIVVHLRFSSARPGQVTGYAVGLPGYYSRDGTSVCYGGGRLGAGLTLPRLRRTWTAFRNAPERSGSLRCTIAEQNAIFTHAARQAALAAEHIRSAARRDPAAAADAAWAAADTLHVAARILRSPELRRAGNVYDRAARAPYGQIPHASDPGNRLRTTARLMAMVGQATDATTLAAAVLIANLAALAIAVASLRDVQQRAAQAAAARAAAVHLCESPASHRLPAPQQDRPQDQRHAHASARKPAARRDSPTIAFPRPPAPHASQPGPRMTRGPSPVRRTRPGR